MRQGNDRKSGDARLLGHLSGIIGVMPLLNVFSDMIRWREFILQFILWWQTHVRPVLHYIFGWVQKIWPFPWPEWGYDYILLCFLFGFGGVRFFQIFYPLKDREGFSAIAIAFVGSTPSAGSGTRRIDLISWKSVRRLILLFLLVFATWPICILIFCVFIFIVIINDGFNRPVREAIFLALSPFIYFSFLLAVNYALFFAGVD